MRNENSPVMLCDGWQVRIGGSPVWKQVPVPGLAGAPGIACPVIYTRKIQLPKGEWTGAVLTLKGARFCPKVEVNGEAVSNQEGGMTVTRHVLRHPAVLPGNEITLTISLCSLDEVSGNDASKIPAADRFRTNISSSLWDEARLDFYKEAAIQEIIPNLDYNQRKLTLQYTLFHQPEGNSIAKAAVYEEGGIIELCTAYGKPAGAEGELTLDLSGLEDWSPDSPKCYKLKLSCGETYFHTCEMTLGIKRFETRGKKFFCNNIPVSLRAGTVVWHRLARDPEMQELAFDPAWFEEHILLRLKRMGANCIRFHLGPPPESFLDLCDRHGMLVQLEWSFFHGVAASYGSLLKQWRDLIACSLRHPSTAILHLWNETGGEEEKKAVQAVKELAGGLPQMVYGHLDVLHVHKYWWSMFENLGLYYDSYDQFDLPIMADEFGGNYLNGYCSPGSYPSLQEGFQRFLGENHTPELRLELHTESNSKIAEYWRRIGAAGFSPFCIFGSTEDGNHHFLGPVKYGIPKPVWAELAPAFAPISVSLDLWDRNFSIGEAVTAPVHLINDTRDEIRIIAECYITAEYSPKRIGSSIYLSEPLPPFGKKIVDTAFLLPKKPGRYRLHVQLVSPNPIDPIQVDSSWRIRVSQIKAPCRLRGKKISVWRDSPELCGFLRENGLEPLRWDEGVPDMLLCPRDASLYFSSGVTGREELSQLLRQGTDVYLLDCGKRELGQGYREPGHFNNFWSLEKLDETETESMELLKDVFVDFTLVTEPESHFHPAQGAGYLWNNLEQQSTWLWNGLKGGLTVPARNMSVRGLNKKAFLNLWEQRGADCEKIKRGGYYAYLLGDYVTYSQGNAQEAEKEAREKLAFLAADAPSLAEQLEGNIKGDLIPLSDDYNRQKGSICEMKALAFCGRGLSRIPLLELAFEGLPGKLVLSQLITQGRLSKSVSNPLFDTRYDPAAAQFILNLISGEAAVEPAAERN